jgi:hypothetical protein
MPKGGSVQARPTRAAGEHNRLTDVPAQASKTPKGGSTPKARTPLQKVNVPAAAAATRPTGFYSTPTKKIEVPALGLSNLTRPTIASSAKSPRAVTPRAANITPRSAGKAAPSPAAKPATPKQATPKAAVRNCLHATIYRTFACNINAR